MAKNDDWIQINKRHIFHSQYTMSHITKINAHASFQNRTHATQPPPIITNPSRILQPNLAVDTRNKIHRCTPLRSLVKTQKSFLHPTKFCATMMNGFGAVWIYSGWTTAPIEKRTTPWDYAYRILQHIFFLEFSEIFEFWLLILNCR